MRIAGRPVGVIANNPQHLGGAIDGPAALKAARFIELCDAFDIAILSLVDCPGFMVGPDSEGDATVRKFCRLFSAGSSLTVPFFVVTTRKGYGLGAQVLQPAKCVIRLIYFVVVGDGRRHHDGSRGILHCMANR